MSILSSHLIALRETIDNPKDGFISIADDVLSLCRLHRLQLEWRDDRCRVRYLGSEEQAEVEMPIRRSGFRAVLARIAKLCNDQAPGTFSPYGGSGKLSFERDSTTILQVTWSNTLAEQWLTIVPVAIAHEPSAVPSQLGNAHPMTDKSSLQQT